MWTVTQLCIPRLHCMCGGWLKWVLAKPGDIRLGTPWEIKLDKLSAIALVPFSTIQEINCRIVVFLGLVLNATLIWLIFKRTSKEMKIYSRILLQTTFIDLFGLINAVCLQPICVMYNGQNVWVTNGVLRFLDQPYSFILILWWFFSAAFSIISNCVPFIYRYLVICRQQVISPLSYAMMLIVTFMFSASFVSVSAWATFPDAEQQMEISNITMGLSNFLDQPINMAPLKIGLIIKTENYKFVISSVYGMCLEIVCYTIIITCGVKIKRTIQAAMRSEFYNKRLAEVNRQLYFVLLFQTLLPAVEIIPCAIYLVASVLADGSTNLYYMAFATVSMHWVPVFSPLVTILVVKPYRNFVFCRNDSESVPPSSLAEKKSINGITVTHITALL